MDLVNEREIMISALQRSGHHAFVDWLLKNCPRHLFLNCVTDERFMRPTFIAGKPEARFVNDLDLSVDRENAGDLTKKELLVYNMESFSVEDAEKVFRSENKVARIGASKQEFFVIWLRDPFNNLASLSRRGKNALIRENSARRQERIEKLNASCELWANHFQAFKRAVNGTGQYVGICCNQWLADRSFRDQLAARFGISSEHEASEMVGWGNGSSFSHFYEGQAAPTPAELETRWQQVKEIPVYRDLFQNAAFRAAVIEFREFYRSPELDQAYAELIDR